MTERSAEYITLKEYIDSRIASIEGKQVLLQEANREAVDKAEKTIAYRLESMNEFRASLSDQTRQYVTKAELGTISVEIRALQRQMNYAVGALAAFQIVIAVAITIWSVLA